MVLFLRLIVHDGANCQVLDGAFAELGLLNRFKRLLRLLLAELILICILILVRYLFF